MSEAIFVTEARAEREARMIRAQNRTAFVHIRERRGEILGYVVVVDRKRTLSEEEVHGRQEST